MSQGNGYRIESHDDDTVRLTAAGFEVRIRADSWRSANGLAHFIGQHIENDNSLRTVRVSVSRLLEEIMLVTREVEQYHQELKR